MSKRKASSVIDNVISLGLMFAIALISYKASIFIKSQYNNFLIQNIIMNQDENIKKDEITINIEGKKITIECQKLNNEKIKEILKKQIKNAYEDFDIAIN